MADGEEFGPFALEILEIQFYFAHVFLHVARRDDGLGALDMLPLVVKAIEQDGDAGLLGNEIEAFLPFLHPGARALGRDA